MSEQNVEIVRAAVERLNRGDVFAIEEAAPNLVFDFSRSVGPQRGVYGLDQLDEFRKEFSEPWDSVRYDVTEFIVSGEDIVTPVRTHHRGRDGIEVQTNAAWVWTFREGKVARICFYQDRREAIEAVGLPDELEKGRS